MIIIEEKCCCGAELKIQFDPKKDRLLTKESIAAWQLKHTNCILHYQTIQNKKAKGV